MIHIDAHLLNFTHTLTLPNGEEKTYEFKSKGGRVFLLWMIGMFIFSMCNNLDFLLWRNICIGSGLAIAWDIVTAILYHVKIIRLMSKNR